MQKPFHDDQVLDDLRKLYPGHTDEWVAQAEENLRRYLEIVIALSDEIAADPERSARLDAVLTQLKDAPTMNLKRSEQEIESNKNR